jgi:hypothetical protein
MPAIPNKRTPSAVETAVSLGVLAVLATVLAWMFQAQRRFNPAVTVAAAAAESAAKAAGAPVASPPELFASWPVGLGAMSVAESFTPATLSDKIDGKAELYLSAGFVAMRCQRVALVANPAAWMEAFVFDMGTPASAFSVHSSQKRPGATEVELGDYAYRAGNVLCVVHGRYYVEIVAADDRVPTMEAATGLARVFVATTAVEQHADVSRDQALFPPEGQLAGSVTLLSTDVFGCEQLTDVFVARYREGDGEVTLFVACRASPAEAGRQAAALRSFFVKDCGGRALSPPAAPAGAAIIDSGGTFDGVFASGPILAGVHQAPSGEAAERWLVRLQAKLPPAQP